MPFTCPEHFLLTEEDFMPSAVIPTEHIKTREEMTPGEYQSALRAEGCYDLDDDGKSFYDEE